MVEEGTGRVPRASDHVTFDRVEWRDGFDGRDKVYDGRRQVCRVSDLFGWCREAMLSMREGETRQIKAPDIRYYGGLPTYDPPYIELRLVSIG